MRAGVLDASGELEIGEGTHWLHLERVSLREMDVDYLLTEEISDDPLVREDEEVEAVEEVLDGPDPGLLQLRINEFSVEGEFGLINKVEEPSYRIFLADAQLTLTDYSNHFHHGPAEARLQGMFMGSGSLRAGARFRPVQAGPDFDMIVALENTELSTMNEMLEAHVGLEVEEGYFSLFSEVAIKDGRIDGYLRPLFGEIEVHDEDEEMGFFEEVFERTVDLVASVLENLPRDEVATEVELSGPLIDPEMSTWEIITGLVRNAFIEAILPGFQGEVGS